MTEDGKGAYKEKEEAWVKLFKGEPHTLLTVGGLIEMTQSDCKDAKKVFAYPLLTHAAARRKRRKGKAHGSSDGTSQHHP